MIEVKQIENKVDLFVMGELGWDFSAEYFIQYLHCYKNEEVVLHLYSPGGSAFDALAIYDFIKTNGINAKARIYGLSGSAATVISCACAEVGIGVNSFYFIHNAFDSSGSEDSSEVIDQINSRLVSIYKKKTNKDEEEIRNMMDAETVMNAQESIDNGFTDTILEETATIAAFKNFKGNKERVLNFQNNQMDFKEKYQELQNKVAALFGINGEVSHEDLVNKINVDDLVNKITSDVQAKFSNDDINEKLSLIDGLQNKLSDATETIQSLKNKIDEIGKDDSMTALKDAVENINNELQEVKNANTSLNEEIVALKESGNPGAGAQAGSPNFSKTEKAFMAKRVVSTKQETEY